MPKASAPVNLLEVALFIVFIVFAVLIIANIWW